MNLVKNNYIGSCFNEVQFGRFPKSECFVYLRTKKGRTLARKRQKRLLVATSAAVIKGKNRYRFMFYRRIMSYTAQWIVVTKTTPVHGHAVKYIRYLLYRSTLNTTNQEREFQSFSYHCQLFL